MLPTRRLRHQPYWVRFGTTEPRESLGRLIAVRLSLGKLLVNLLQLVKRTNIPLV